MESVIGFDAAGVMARAVELDPAGASLAELLWADRAADRLRGWLDEWQARVHVELASPRPVPQPSSGPNEADHNTDDAGGTAGEHGGGLGASEPLPLLGDGPRPVESPREQERKYQRAGLLADLPALADLLRAGRVSTSHVDVLAVALGRVPDAIRHRVIDGMASLLHVACASNPDRFARAVQQAITIAYDREGIECLARQRRQSTLRRGVDRATGMYWLHAEVDPERGAVLFGRLDAEREALFHRGAGANSTREQVELQALSNLTSTTGGEQKSSTGKVHASIIIDIATLTIGAHERTICETSAGQPLPVDVARALACAAQISFGFAIKGRVVHHLANATLATPDQRRQLRMMYRTCIGYDCDVPFEHCQIHHIIPRSRDGPTTIALLAPLCDGHHDDIHHRGWILDIDHERTITWTPPGGPPIVLPFHGLEDTGQPTLFPPPHTAA